MSVRLCATDNDYSAWDHFVSELEGAHYFQTFGWLRSYQPMGFTPHVLLYERDGEITGGVGFLSLKLPLLWRRIVVIPHGPLPPSPDAPAWQPVMQALDAFCQERGVIYAQLYPHESAEKRILLAEVERFGFTQPALFGSHRFSSTPVMVNLHGKTEDEILRSLRKKTRQYVRHALKSELVLRTAVDDGIFERIYQLLLENGELMGYQPRPYASLRAAWEWFAPRGSATFVQAWHADVLVGAILLVFTGRTAYYLAGAVRRGFEEQCPAEFLHWYGIREALARQMHAYDLVNISTPGVEQFKRGFRPDVGCWHEPRTKVYAPVLAQVVTIAERYLRPVLRGAARLRARLAGTPAVDDQVSAL